jgi:hypothetical protein
MATYMLFVGYRHLNVSVADRLTEGYMLFVGYRSLNVSVADLLTSEFLGNTMVTHCLRSLLPSHM